MVVTLNRSIKVVPLVGPQGYGLIPTLTNIVVKAENADPNAICANRDIDASQSSTGMCNGGSVITIDNGSVDPDKWEVDTLVTALTKIVRPLPYATAVPSSARDVSSLFAANRGGDCRDK